MRSSDPSHTMMAKDSAGHPVNELAGLMAVTATSEVLSSLTLNRELPISAIINHPLHSHLYDDQINEWINAERNLEEILRASLSVCFFENILACVALSFTHRKMLNKLQEKGDNYFFILNKIIKFFPTLPPIWHRPLLTGSIRMSRVSHNCWTKLSQHISLLHTAIWIRRHLFLCLHRI